MVSVYDWLVMILYACSNSSLQVYVAEPTYSVVVKEKERKKRDRKRKEVKKEGRKEERQKKGLSSHIPCKGIHTPQFQFLKYLTLWSGVSLLKLPGILRKSLFSRVSEMSNHSHPTPQQLP